MIIWSDCIGTKRRFINLAPMTHFKNLWEYPKTSRPEVGLSTMDGWEDYGAWLAMVYYRDKMLRRHGFRVSDGTNEYRWRA